MTEVTKDIKVMWNGAEHTVKIKRLTGGEQNDIGRAATSVKFLANGEMIRNLDQWTLNEHTVLKGISVAPFQLTIEEIRKLDHEDFNLLLKEIEEFNAPRAKKKEQLS